jgi:hypothetical protein
MTRSMSRWAVAGCMALAAMGAVTVLDVGSATAEAAPSVSQFAGSWSGPWSVAEAGQDGTLDWTVSDAGRLTGRVYHAQDGDGGWGAVVGHVGADGTLNLIAYAPADTSSHGNGVPHQGTVVIDEEGNLLASFTATFSGGLSVVAVLERD